MALHSLYCAAVLLRNCSLTHTLVRHTRGFTAACVQNV